MELLGSNSHRNVSDRSAILIGSKSKKRSIIYHVLLCLRFFASFTFSFVQRLQAAENITFLVIENIGSQRLRWYNDSLHSECLFCHIN